MACGVPVIATNRWGTPEALGPAHPGLVAQADPEELAHKVIAVLSQPEMAKAVKRDQLNRIRAFDLAATVARHEELYANVRAAK
jgi:glycosyltransferase involved in cell wall biosynthesis